MGRGSPLRCSRHLGRPILQLPFPVCRCERPAWWKERWRIYELWLFCAICALLVKASVHVGPVERIVNGRWTLKFPNDRLPVLSCVIGSSTLEIFYQYFEGGGEEGNMPDIAVRAQEAGKWLLILDPKMGRSYRNAELTSVCLRYAAAFDAALSIVANYFPDEPSNDELASEHRALLCHGLRPNNFSTIAGAVRSSFAGAGLALPPSSAICILIDASGSMSASLKATEQLVLRVIEDAPSLVETAPGDFSGGRFHWRWEHFWEH
jgi:hypothetical protein